MFQLFIRSTQISVLIVWVLYAISFVQPFAEPWQEVIFWAGNILVIAHLLEYVALRGRIAQAGGKGLSAFVGTMIFGYGYWLPLMRQPVTA